MQPIQYIPMLYVGMALQAFTSAVMSYFEMTTLSVNQQLSAGAFFLSLSMCMYAYSFLSSARKEKNK